MTFKGNLTLTFVNHNDASYFYDEYLLLNDDTGEPVADFHVDDFNGGVEIAGGVLDLERHGNKGYMSRGLEMLCKLLFENDAELPFIFVNIDTDNAFSIKLALKCGFIKTPDDYYYLFNPNSNIVNRWIENIKSAEDANYMRTVYEHNSKSKLECNTTPGAQTQKKIHPSRTRKKSFDQR